MLFCIMGSSGSGKTSCLPGLRALFPHIPWYDLHERGVVPPNLPPDRKPSLTRGWRHEMTEYWLQQAIEHQMRGEDMGLCDVIHGEVLACPSAARLDGIATILLDCADVTRIDRLRARGDDPAWIGQPVLNWASWQRMHAADPQWQPEVIRDDSGTDMRWERWSAWQRGDARWHIPTIDTTTLPVEEVVERLAGWMIVQRQRVAALPRLLDTTDAG